MSFGKRVLPTVFALGAFGTVFTGAINAMRKTGMEEPPSCNSIGNIVVRPTATPGDICRNVKSSVYSAIHPQHGGFSVLANQRGQATETNAWLEDPTRPIVFQRCTNPSIQGAKIVREITCAISGNVVANASEQTRAE